MEQKKVVIWTPKRVEKRTASGSVIPDDYIGKFTTKVPEGTPGAIRNQGENEAGRKWDFWEKHVDSIAGKLRWIDKRSSDYGAQIVLFLESDKFLHQIVMPYDKDFNLQTVMNHICGLGKVAMPDKTYQNQVTTAIINISYWVRKKLEYQTKKVVTGKDGKPIWQKSISFRDINPAFSPEQWKDFAQTAGIAPFYETKPNGKEFWNNFGELKYWDTRMAQLQRYLLTTPDVLPFTYNSMICCEALNPSGGENLTTAEIAKAREIYEMVKDRYRFPYSRQETNADDAFEDMGERNAGIVLEGKEYKPMASGGDANFPAEAHSDFYQNDFPDSTLPILLGNEDGSDLPF
jgi:hypothetical protein